MYLAVWEVQILDWTLRVVDAVQGSRRQELTQSLQRTLIPVHYCVCHFPILFHIEDKVGRLTVKLSRMRAQIPAEQKNMIEKKDKSEKSLPCFHIFMYLIRLTSYLQGK